MMDFYGTATTVSFINVGKYIPWILWVFRHFFFGGGGRFDARRRIGKCKKKIRQGLLNTKLRLLHGNRIEAVFWIIFGRGC